MTPRRLEWALSVVATLAAIAGFAAVATPPRADASASDPQAHYTGSAHAADRAASVDLSGLSRSELNERCEGCHVEETAEWRDSPHHTSYSDPVFQRSFAREPRATCQGCHAPEADAHEEPDAWAAANGITCVTCHLDDDGRIMATTAADIAAAPHDLRPTADFEGEAACARCHEFDFPRTPRNRDPGPMQLTITEHGRSEFADIACADCHMGPEGDDAHAGHGFFVTRNDDLLREAIAVEVRRHEGKMIFDLTPIGVGHSFPTGDLFRRIELRAEAIDDEGRVVATSFRYLARHFPAPKYERHDERPDVPDDRLDGPTTVELPLDDVAAPHDVRWSVRYQRVDQRFAAAPETSTLSGETVLAEGWS